MNGLDFALSLFELKSTQPSVAHHVLGAVFTKWLISTHGLNEFVQLLKQCLTKEEFQSTFASMYCFRLESA
jgi:hypothetical protein